MPDKKIKEMGKLAAPERDDTGYISPYRRRLQARVAQENAHDASGFGSTIGRGSYGGQTARARLTEIHAASKKKDGGKRGR